MQKGGVSFHVRTTHTSLVGARGKGTPPIFKVIESTADGKCEEAGMTLERSSRKTTFWNTRGSAALNNAKLDCPISTFSKRVFAKEGLTTTATLAGLFCKSAGIAILGAG